MKISERSDAVATVVLSRIEAIAIFRMLEASEHLSFELVGPRDFVRTVREDFRGLLTEMGYDPER